MTIDPPIDPDRGRDRNAEGGGAESDGRRRDRDRRDAAARRRAASDRPGRDADRRPVEGPALDREDVDTYGIDLANPPTEDPDEGRTGGSSTGGPSTLTWPSGVVALVGLWIAASGLVYDSSAVALWNNAATGGAILLLAGYGAVRTLRGDRPEVLGAGVAALLGLWTVLAPSLLASGTGPFAWSTTASGVAVAALSGYSAYEIRRSGAGRTAGTQA